MDPIGDIGHVECRFSPMVLLGAKAQVDAI
jgi:hypothetical protein